MRTQHGKSVYKGIAIGKISIYKNGQGKRRHVEDVEAEIKRFEEHQAVEELGKLYGEGLY